MLIASLHFGEMQIKGTGTVSADRASLDIHLEITNTKVSQPTPSQPILSAPPAFFKVKDQLAPKAKVCFLKKPVFGSETGNRLPCLPPCHQKSGPHRKLKRELYVVHSLYHLCFYPVQKLNLFNFSAVAEILCVYSV